MNDIPIVVEETTFVEKEGYLYSVQEGSIIHYFKSKTEAEKKARQVGSEVEEL